jgi:TetR/AcrR family transcriptional regulator, regulator of cefoperazone and chloramphenicol sensitivity
MDEKNQTAEEKIISAGIECIDRYGIEGVTSRRIAAIAGVNGAAINYYFRSKEVLIQKCLEQSLENAFDWKQYKDMAEATTQELLSTIFHDILDGALKYPGIARFHLIGIIESKAENPTVKRMGEFLLVLENVLLERNIQARDNQLRLVLADVFYSLLMATVAPTAFKQSLGIDLNDQEARSQFIEHLIQQVVS